jgi:hypothetical protein
LPLRCDDVPLELWRAIGGAERWDEDLRSWVGSIRSYFLLEPGVQQEQECPTWERCLDIVGVPLLDMLRGTLVRRCGCCLCIGDRWWNWYEDAGAVEGRRDAI